MSRVLFLNQPTVGHLNTLLSIATQMRDDGHDVRFLVPGLQGIKTNIQIFDTGFTIPDRIKRNGIPCDLVPPPLSVMWKAIVLLYKSGHDEALHAYDLFTTGLIHYTRHILKLIEIHRPEVMVTDFAFPATSLVADVAKSLMCLFIIVVCLFGAKAFRLLAVDCQSGLTMKPLQKAI